MQVGEVAIEDQRNDCRPGYEWYWSVFIAESWDGIKHYECGTESTREDAEVAAAQCRRSVIARRRG